MTSETLEKRLMKCSRCDSQNVWHFRMDSDWGSGGDYNEVNGDGYKDRPDIQTYVCENCWAIADNLVVAV